jgi:hypothetical protein
MARSKMSRRVPVEAWAGPSMPMNIECVEGDKRSALRWRAASADRFSNAAIFQGSVNRLTPGFGSRALLLGAISVDPWSEMGPGQR